MTGQPAGSAAAFETLLAEATADGARFGHREHVRLTWLAVRRYGVPEAIVLVSAGIQRTARYAGAPQKYHLTMSRAWVELVGHHAAEHDEPNEQDFETFAERHPALLDKRLLTRFYRTATLAAAEARTGWVEPDLAPFPWQPLARSGVGAGCEDQPHDDQPDEHRVEHRDTHRTEAAD
jgi:hypothetical protein